VACCAIFEATAQGNIVTAKQRREQDRAGGNRNAFSEPDELMIGCSWMPTFTSWEQEPPSAALLFLRP
jgi:hypothetical protein